MENVLSVSQGGKQLHPIIPTFLVNFVIVIGYQLLEMPYFGKCSQFSSKKICNKFMCQSLYGILRLAIFTTFLNSKWKIKHWEKNYYCIWRALYVHEYLS